MSGDYHSNLSGIKPNGLDAALFYEKVNQGIISQTQSILQEALDVMNMFCNLKEQEKSDKSELVGKRSKSKESDGSNNLYCHEKLDLSKIKQIKQRITVALN